ncbi:MAG: methylated-DNA--[protein]-cysteine S-methyltransferase [Acidobacteriota bacterium]|nr:methylated-DNA--[protein]-cysteine S-methyltransferase [Acidobacteriota bacterium]MDH3522664.1 methylated-DNA--[protein]-cysteine S-methyltransferase [Acidobacteriota bacterium]
MKVYASRIPTPVDDMIAAVDEAGNLVLLVFVAGRRPEELVESLGEVTWRDAPLAGVRRQLDEYFAGRRRTFDLPIAPAGTEFQQRVWKEVRDIPYGATASYGELAAILQRRGASRAVGRANATNPVCLVTPCHRVIGSDGSLTGFGGGLETKRWLLAHESAQARLL